MEQSSHKDKKMFNVFIEKIKSIREWIADNALSGILKYSDKQINETYFWQQKEKIEKKDITDFISEIDDKISIAYNLKKEIKDSNLSIAENKFLLKNIDWLIKRYEICKLSVFFEAEKWWTKSVLTEKEKIELIEKINVLQSEIYWLKIHEQEKEKNEVISFMNHKFIENKKNLWNEESERFTRYLQQYNTINKSQSTIIAKNDNIKISREQAVVAIHKIISLLYKEPCVSIIQTEETDKYYHNLETNIHYFPYQSTNEQIDAQLKNINEESSFKVISKDKVLTMSCSEKSINLSGWSTISLSRFCELLDHEIWTHFVRTLNAKKFWLTKSDDYNETEEWIALINEQLATKKSLPDISNEPSIHHISTFIAENNNYNDTFELLKIWYLLNGKSQTKAEELAKSRSERVKRFYSNEYPWANRKDVSYWRWSFDVFNFLKNSTPLELKEIIKKIYVGNISKDDVNVIQEIIQENNVDNEPIIPIMIGKIIYAKLLNQWWTMTLQEIQQQDPRFNKEILNIDYQTKKDILSILHFLK